MKTEKQELEAIRKKHGGMLRPKDVVAYAKNKKTALHSKFQWDDTAAAHEYRLWQAREVIQVHVVIVGVDEQPIRAYVSLSNDRGKEGGGYRCIKDVLSDEELHGQLLIEAFREYERVSEKYKQLKELKLIDGEIKKAQAKWLKVSYG